jgi:hemerythrin
MEKKSNLVSWSPNLSVGVKAIDDQHKELLKMTNDLFNHCVGDEASERVYFNKIIHSAVDYVKVHFSTEEKIMTALNYPGFREHKKEHDTFVLTVADMAREFNEGKKVSLVVFTRFLKDWILTHIAVSDKKYFEYFKQIASRKADGSMTITRADMDKAQAS